MHVLLYGTNYCVVLFNNLQFAYILQGLKYILAWQKQTMTNEFYPTLYKIYYFVLLLTQAWIKVAVNSTFKRYGQNAFIEALKHLIDITPIPIVEKERQFKMFLKTLVLLLLLSVANFEGCMMIHYRFKVLKILKTSFSWCNQMLLLWTHKGLCRGLLSCQLGSE